MFSKTNQIKKETNNIIMKTFVMYYFSCVFVRASVFIQNHIISEILSRSFTCCEFK